jgi:hypothetical protein
MKNIKVTSSNATKWALLVNMKVFPFETAPKDEIKYWCMEGDKKWTRYVPPKKADDEIQK